MEVAILTVGDEVLAGDTPNTNATWLASELTDRGATVARILTVPDEHDLIVETLRRWGERFDAVIVTGGLGGTHDDVTADALAAAFGRELVVDDAVREDVLETVAAYREENPETVAAHDVEIDVDAWAALPEGSRVLLNPEGLCPGCVLENVYAFPGVPDEMKALFSGVVAEFGGETVTRTLYTPQPEGSMLDALAGVRERFDVAVGSYPATEGQNRLKLSGTDPEAVAGAVEWLRGRVEIAEE
ncbi:competence/damage-inducible protein A [Halalkalicoccus jeotgali]|uniref:Molybdopterin binding domain protein n=1 Tax=Halalkalicoccus jeotgali (strain DSM 18796 / CECT 7217 / JCM 14584 / KCTC 4019 / B3) TaxID=795797 RepID=D8J4U1_HALJB|nr:molybdopterin-binding protein [Halalkalicoccus jeotgali]ADJ15558.1 molybdopterin binding domain protein [Halalkalicoccus jeotgali B3]ELY36033.1 molybdopterin binding domain-containing protein [Halalkalicoccus jeotgali B3]